MNKIDPYSIPGGIFAVASIAKKMNKKLILRKIKIIENPRSKLY
jgi:hypothetical protein